MGTARTSASTLAETLDRLTVPGGRCRPVGQGKIECLRTCYVSNGNATAEALDFLRPWTDCYKVDLKAMEPGHYRALGIWRQ